VNSRRYVLQKKNSISDQVAHMMNFDIDVLVASRYLVLAGKGNRYSTFHVHESSESSRVL